MSKRELLESLVKAIKSGNVEVEDIDLSHDDDEDERPRRKVPKRDPAIDARVLKDMLPISTRPNPFKVGDVIKLEKDRSVYRFPSERDNALAVVAQVLERPEKPSISHSNDENVYCYNDIVILARVYQSGEPRWVHFIVDSWRFELYDGEIYD